MIRVKICGLQTLDDVRACVNAGADALGFIFADGPRTLSVEQAAMLTAAVPPFVTCVGVFADSPESLIRRALAQCRLDVLQFAGDEPAGVRGGFGKPTIAVTGERTPDAGELSAARAIAVMGDAVGDGRRGGTGRRLPDEVALRIRRSCRLPFILAGGLRPETVAHAIRTIKPDAVDVRSGVERHGRFDQQLVRAFVIAAKEAVHATT